MSHSPRLSRVAFAAAAGAALSLGAAAPANAAIDKQLIYQCKFPVVAPGTITMDVQAPDVPSLWPIGEPTPAWRVDATITLDAPLPKSLSAITNLATIEGVPGGVIADTDLELHRSDGDFSVSAPFDLTVPVTPFELTADPTRRMDLRATGHVPSQYQDDPASATLALKALFLNFIARDANGMPLRLAPVRQDFDGTPISDSDGNPDTFDVVCRLDPATPAQTLGLTALEFGIPDDGRAYPISGVRATPSSGAVALSWTKPWGSVAEYRVYRRGTDAPVATVSEPSATIAGLTDGTEYWFAVTAVLPDGQESAKSEWLRIKAGEVVTPTPPTPPGRPAVEGEVGHADVVLTWDASTSSDGVKGYEVLRDGRPVAYVTDNIARVGGLTPGASYVFTVVAVSEEGVRSAASPTTTVTTLRDTVSPSAPTVEATPSSSSVSLRWSGATDDVGIVAYEIYRNTTKVAELSADARMHEVGGLTSDTAYTFGVVARDGSGNRSEMGSVSTRTVVDDLPRFHKRLAYQCKFPIIAPGTITWDLDLPSPGWWSVGRPTPEWTVRANARLEAPIPKALSSIKGLASLESAPSGVILDAALQLRRADGEFTVPAVTELEAPRVPFAPTSDPTKTFDISASGTAPTQYQDDPAEGRMVLRDIRLNFIARDATGAPIKLSPVTRDWDDQPIVDSDRNPETFDVICRLDPNVPDQTLLLNGITFAWVETMGPPSVPGPITVAGTTTDSVSLRWGAATDPDGAVKGYRVYQNGALVKTVTGTSADINGLPGGATLSFQVSAVDDDDLEGPKTAAVSVAVPHGDDWPPATPAEAPRQPGDVGLTSAIVRWGAAVDAEGPIKSYVIQLDDETRTVPGDQREVTFTGLGAETEYEALIWAVDGKGQRSATPLVVSFETAFDDNLFGPTTPGTPTGTATSRTITLTWSASTDSDGIREYRVFQNGSSTPVAVVTRPTATITGLRPATAYKFKVVAVDGKGLAGSASQEASFSTQAERASMSYSLAGSAQIKTLSRGTLPISGGIDASLDVETGLIEADLRLNQTSGRLTALGFLPVTAKIGFAPSGKTTGSLREGSLETRSLVRIKVQEVKLFGAIPLTGGNNCQTKSLSEIKLKNTQEFFDYTVGGPIAGTFAISDLNGCGVLNGLVSPLTAGGGNTLRLALAPKATTGG